MLGPTRLTAGYRCTECSFTALIRKARAALNSKLTDGRPFDRPSPPRSGLPGPTPSLARVAHAPFRFELLESNKCQVGALGLRAFQETINSMLFPIRWTPEASFSAVRIERQGHEDRVVLEQPLAADLDP